MHPTLAERITDSDASTTASTQRSATDLSRIVVIIPTLNAASTWSDFVAGLAAQQISPQQVLVVDSASSDATPDLARQAGFQVISIERAKFNHGGTRQAALAAAPWAEFAVYLTQDAYLAAPDAIRRLLAPFDNAAVGATFGRQLPHEKAGILESYARQFNYPDRSVERSWESRKSLGIKAAFLSNSFAAYRIQALMDVGGFPTDVIMAEDTIVSARLLSHGWRTVYVADALVRHSHPYSVLQEFRRYFDTGVYHDQESWLLKEFGGASGEGIRFVRAELAHVTPRHIHLVPMVLLRSAAKMLGYRLGRMQRRLPYSLKRMLSMHRHFWVVGR